MNIIVLLSGGVDSAVSSILLKEKGHNIIGLYLKLNIDSDDFSLYKVRKLSSKLEIPLIELDLQCEFKEKVINYFIDSYKKGNTPNPCVICNHLIKFNYAIKLLDSRGYDMVASGHYAKIDQHNGNLFISNAYDKRKDQSYFLNQLPRTYLKKILFPLSSLTKTETISIAERFQIRQITESESQDICFLKGNYRDYLIKNAGFTDNPGDIVDLKGKKIGIHRGLFNYTIGQRGGIGIPHLTPYYVKKIDLANNLLIVCKKDELLEREILVRDLNWFLPMEEALGNIYNVRLRYRHQGERAKLEVSEKGENYLKLVFEKPVMAPTPGQFAVIYNDETVIGGGEIC